MEDKENDNRSIWNQVNSTLENTFVSSKVLDSSILKQIMPGINCSSPHNTVGDTESAVVKSKVMSLAQTFLQKTNTEKQIKPDVSNCVLNIPEKHILGSYHGRIVSSKVNSFRKVPEKGARKNSPNALPKSGVKIGPSSNSTSTRDAKATGNTGAPKLLNSTPFQARAIRVSVYHPKTILDHEKQSLSGVTENNGAVQRNGDRNWKPVLKTIPANANNSVHRTKKLASSTTITGNLTTPVSKIHAPVSASKSVPNKKIPTSADFRRAQLSEWQASKRVKKLPHSIPVSSQPKTAICQQTVKEPVGFFWATLVEEDEQGLLSDSVNKTLAECLHLIEKGHIDETVHSTLEKLIVTVPDTKKLAKYWMCQMRVEQFRSMEKVIGIYEEAILAGAQPKDELRHTFVDVIKARRDLPKSDGECVEEENTVNHGVVAEIDIEEAFKEVSLKEYSNEVSQSTEVCSKSKQDFSKEKKNRHKEQKQKPIDLKNEQTDTNAEKDGILETGTPENEKASYLIKYNLSTTSHLESTKKKLQHEDSVKDLKFLTPVRRSCRIHEKADKLPSMLKDHSPCVSSLEQLGKLGNEGTGFIYRPNNALQTSSVCQHEQSKE